MISGYIFNNFSYVQWSFATLFKQSNINIFIHLLRYHYLSKKLLKSQSDLVYGVFTFFWDSLHATPKRQLWVQSVGNSIFLALTGAHSLYVALKSSQSVQPTYSFCHGVQVEQKYQYIFLHWQGYEPQLQGW